MVKNTKQVMFKMGSKIYKVNNSTTKEKLLDCIKLLEEQRKIYTTLNIELNIYSKY